MNKPRPFRLILVLCYILIALKLQIVHVVEAIEIFSVSRILQLQNSNDNDLLFGLLNEKLTSDTSHVQELYMDQRLDHFASYSTKDIHELTFSQRYFYSAANLQQQHDTENLHHRYIRGDTKNNQGNNGNVFAFLCCGGEGPSLNKNVLVDSVHCTGDMIELASIMKNTFDASVHLFALEHRYYGKSYPKFKDGSSPVSNSNLRFLSSRQAISDIANFIEYAKVQYGLDDNVKWITFGGSYPGMIAAWSRLKFPHLIYGAVSNSAPVQVLLDFKGYNDVVSRALKDEMIGGSNQCYDVVKSGHDEIALVLAKDTEFGKAQIATMFNLCGGSDALSKKKNVASFLGDGVFFVNAQGNDPSCDGDYCNIQKVSSIQK